MSGFIRYRNLFFFYSNNCPALADPNFIGCYEDQGDRGLPVLVHTIKSPKECIKQCLDKGFRFAAVQVNVFIVYFNEQLSNVLSCWKFVRI